MSRKDEARRVARVAVMLGARDAVVHSFKRAGERQAEHVVAITRRVGTGGLVRVAGYGLGTRGFDALPGAWQDAPLVIDLWRGNAMMRSNDVIDEVGTWLSADRATVDIIRQRFEQAAASARQAGVTRAGRRRVAIEHLPGLLAREIIRQPAAADILLEQRPLRLSVKDAVTLWNRVADVLLEDAADWSVLDAEFSPVFAEAMAAAAFRRIADTVEPRWRQGRVLRVEPGRIWDAMQDLPLRLRVRQREVYRIACAAQFPGTSGAVLLLACEMADVSERVVLAALTYGLPMDDTVRWEAVSAAQAALFAERNGVVDLGLVDPYRDTAAMRAEVRELAGDLAMRWNVG